jgi:hypothetical protein
MSEHYAPVPGPGWRRSALGEGQVGEDSEGGDRHLSLPSATVLIDRHERAGK